MIVIFFLQQTAHIVFSDDCEEIEEKRKEEKTIFNIL